MSATIVDLLDSFRAHLTAFTLPELYSVHVITARDALAVSAQLTTHHPPQIATELLTWADTLTNVTTEAWRVPSGDTVHLSVIGQLPNGVTIRVYGGVPFTEHGIGATVPLTVLRHLATPGEVSL